MSPYHRHCFCFSFAGCPCKNFIFSHGHLYFSEEHPYFTTDITIFQSIFYKLVIIYFLFVYVWNTLPHIVHKAAIFVRIYPVPCKHFSGQRLSPAEMRFSFTHPDVYLTGIHPCCPTISPGWGCIFPPFLKRSLPRYLPYKVEGPAARRMQAADPFAIDTVFFRAVLAQVPVRRLYSIGGVHSPPEPLPELPPEPPESPPLGAATIGVVRTVSAAT